MSLLLSQGQTDARRYPLSMVWEEALIVRQRCNDMLSTEAVLMQATIASVIGGGNVLKKAIERLRADGER